MTDFENFDGGGVVRSLSSEMRCFILSDPKGTIVIVHDKDIRSELQWVEYDAQDHSLSLIHEEGQVQDLGIKLNETMRANILHGMDIKLVKLENKVLYPEQSTILIIKDYDQY